MKPESPFSRDSVSGIVADYIKTTNDLCPHNWERLLKACGSFVTAQEEKKATIGAPSLKMSRQQLYIASSPAPEEEY